LGGTWPPHRGAGGFIGLSIFQSVVGAVRWFAVYHVRPTDRGFRRAEISGCQDEYEAGSCRLLNTPQFLNINWLEGRICPPE